MQWWLLVGLVTLDLPVLLSLQDPNMSLLTSARLRMGLPKNFICLFKLDPPMLATGSCHNNFSIALRWYLSVFQGQFLLTIEKTQFSGFLVSNLTSFWQRKPLPR